MKTARVEARVALETKNAAKAVLEHFGLTVSQGIEIFLNKVALEGGIPFDVKIPNKLTAETLEKASRGEDLHEVKDTNQLFKELEI